MSDVSLAVSMHGVLFVVFGLLNYSVSCFFLLVGCPLILLVSVWHLGVYSSRFLDVLVLLLLSIKKRCQ